MKKNIYINKKAVETIDILELSKNSVTGSYSALVSFRLSSGRSIELVFHGQSEEEIIDKALAKVKASNGIQYWN